MSNKKQNNEFFEFIKRRMLNTKEAAFYLGLSVIIVRRKASAGLIQSYKPNGKNIYFDIEDLDEYLFSKQRSSVEKSREKASMLNFKISKRWKM